jgi:outer membrane protein OmpA-like peptidoglycan-associated protein
VAAAVNASGAPVTAAVVKTADGKQKLVITAKDAGFDAAAGAASALAVAEASNGATGQALSPKQSQAAANAEVVVDGKPYTGRGNRLEGAVPGVTLVAQRAGAAETLALAAQATAPAAVVASQQPAEGSASTGATFRTVVGGGAQAGKHAVQVKRLAAPAVFRSAVYPSDAAQVAAGTLRLRVGTGQWKVRIADGISLSQVADAVKASGAPVAVAVQRQGGGFQLVLTSRMTGFDAAQGAASALAVTETSSGKLGAPLSVAKAQDAANAEWLVDGKAFSSRTDTLSGAIPGVALVASAAGDAETLSLDVVLRDADKDGFADASDSCVTEPETVNGFEDADGCPDVAPRVTFVNGKFDLREQVRFETSKAVILPESQGLLDEVARLLNAHAEVKVVRVEGHTDSRGERAYNVKLSANRARAVVDALVKRGVKAERLKSQGFGPDKPVDTNDTDEGRAKNRRTDFYVVQ